MVGKWRVLGRGRRQAEGVRPVLDAVGPAAPHPVALSGSPTSRKSAERNHVRLLRSVVVVVGNVTVLSALLVYFGWKRSEVQAQGLGIDESLLGMSTQEYILRSVGSVLVLLIVMAVFGLVWVLLDRWLTVRRHQKGADDRVYRWVSRLLPASIVLLPLAAWLARGWWPEGAYIGFPLLCGAGLLLFLYAFALRAALPGAIPLSAGALVVLRVSTVTLVAVALFTAATNYATVEAGQLVRAFERQVPTLPGVVVLSVDPLNIEAPGVDTTQLATESGYRFRYSGLRLLERVGGQYFLITDDWTRQFGVVVVLKENEPGVRYEFVRGGP